jgi:hypothetical protein
MNGVTLIAGSWVRNLTTLACSANSILTLQGKLSDVVSTAAMEDPFGRNADRQMPHPRWQSTDASAM